MLRAQRLSSAANLHAFVGDFEMEDQDSLEVPLIATRPDSGQTISNYVR